MSSNEQQSPARHCLHVLNNEPNNGRRAFLLVGTAATLAACGPGTMMGDDAGTGADTMTPTDTVTPTDTSMSGPDTSMMTGEDAGADASMSGPEAGPEGGMSCSALPTVLGPVANFPMGSWRTVGSLIVGHDAAGYYAYTNVCTHSGCEVPAPTSGTSRCPCHGSMFDGTGAVLMGPASRPLAHVLVTLCDGMLSANPSMMVPSSTRVGG